MNISTQTATGHPVPAPLAQPAGVSVTKLHPLIGAEVHGVDLSQPLDAATLQFVKQAWYDSTVLVFRNQNLDSDDQRRFASYFGPIAERLKPPPTSKAATSGLVDWNDLMIISNETDANGDALGVLGHGEMWFHTDKCYVERPHRASFLYGLTLPSEGGHTRFSSLYAAYDRLSDELKARLEGKMVMQGQEYSVGRRINIHVDLASIHHHRQPIIVTNPDSGRKGLYVSSQNTMWIEGMDPDESEALLEELFHLAEEPDIIYEHVWQVGDLLMWDNLSCLHARTDWPKGELRKLRRCTVIGDKLF